MYEHAGGHSYGSTYPGPIGAILSPQLTGITSEKNASLPYASSLCGACYQVCPVKINIPEILVHLRDEDIRTQHGQRVDRAEPAPATEDPAVGGADAVSYTHLTLPTTCTRCRSRWSPYH